MSLDSSILDLSLGNGTPKAIIRYYSRRHIYISIQSRILSISFLIKFKLLNSIDTHKHGNKEKLSIYGFSLVTCKLVIWKKLVRN